MPADKCGKRPNPLTQRAAFLRYQQCKSGIDVDPTLGNRPAQNKKKKGPTFT